MSDLKDEKLQDSVDGNEFHSLELLGKKDDV